MITRTIDKALEKLPGFGRTGGDVSSAIHEAVMNGGRPARWVADALHGTWLGHPLHPVLTDLTIGAWASAALLDALAAIDGSRATERAADRLTAAGILSAVPTALSGLTDFSTIQKPAVSTASLHGVLNTVNLALYLLSLRERRSGNRRRGVFFSTLALALTLVSAWIGGHLVYAQQVGVDHSRSKGPDDWKPVLDDAALPEGEPKRVTVGDSPVLLYRYQGRVHAIGAVCSHAGGPLEEGTFDGCTVTCPWHDSVFDLQDGRVAHGPATQPQPQFASRVRDGKIEVRLLWP